MSFRKLAAYAPLAVLVGALVHVAAAGADHVPGKHGCLALLAAVAGGLVAALAAAFLAGVAGSPRRSISTRADLVYGTFALALGGTGSYALIEALEGHVGSGGVLRALAASFPVAALALAGSRRAERAAAAAGIRLAATPRRSAPACADERIPARRRRTAARRRLGAEARRGRSPPLFV